MAGLVVNVVTAWILSRATRTLNTHGALLHVLSDLLGSAAAIVAGAVIVATGWTPIDPILSIAVSLLILRSTWRLMADSIGVLMERRAGAPRLRRHRPRAARGAAASPACTTSTSGR